MTCYKGARHRYAFTRHPRGIRCRARHSRDWLVMKTRGRGLVRVYLCHTNCCCCRCLLLLHACYFSMSNGRLLRYAHPTMSEHMTTSGAIPRLCHSLNRERTYQGCSLSSGRLAMVTVTIIPKRQLKIRFFWLECLVQFS